MAKRKKRFDSLTYVKRLVSAGVKRGQAEVQARAMADLMFDDDIVRRGELYQVRTELKRDIHDLRVEMKHDMKEMRNQLVLQLGSLMVLLVGAVGSLMTFMR